MAYNKTVWENSPSTRTPINKDNLNKIEEGIFNALEKYSPSGSESSIEKVDSLRSKNKALEFKIGEQWYTVVTKGLDGLTFTPNVSDDGIISWTNNGSVENPEPKNIKGPKGISLRYRGLYSSDTSYEFNETYIDLVTYKNSLWIKNNTNQSEPGSSNDWSLAAKQGEKGDKGDIGNTPNITVGTVSGLPAGSTPKVTITGTPENPVINFSIPKGDKGDKGDIPVLGIGNIETLPEGSQATASISGTNENPRINLGIPRGNTGRQGDTGKTPNLTIGNVETVEYGVPSSAEITGDAENPILNLKLQKGKDGEGSGDMSKEVYDTNNNGIVDNAEKVNNFTVNRNVLANEYTNDQIDSKFNAIKADMEKSIYDTNDNGIVDNAEKVNNFTVNRNVLANEYTNEQIDTKIKSIIKTITILPEEWIDGEYILIDQLITEDSIQEFILPEFSEINEEIVNVLRAADIVDNGQEVGKAKIKCLGKIPEIEVKIKVIFKN